MTDVLRTRRYRKVTSYKLDLSQMLGELLGLLLKQSIKYYKNQQDNYSHFKTIVLHYENCNNHCYIIFVYF